MGLALMNADAPHGDEGRAASALPWDEWARMHHRRLVNYLLALGVPLHRAEEIAQTTWETLMEKERAGKLLRIDMPGLALAQARFLALEYKRSELPRIASADSLDEALVVRDEHPERALVSRNQIDRAMNTVSQMSEQRQFIFQQFYKFNQSAPDIAKETSLSVQRVRQILCEVRGELRAALGDL